MVSAEPTDWNPRGPVGDDAHIVPCAGSHDAPAGPLSLAYGEPAPPEGEPRKAFAKSGCLLIPVLTWLPLMRELSPSGD